MPGLQPGKKKGEATMSTMQELLSAIGQEATVKLVSNFGGLRLYVPQSPRPADAIARCVGFSNALKLARVWGGDRMDVPRPALRRARILDLRASGMSVEAIAREMQCTTRRVYQVLAESRRAVRAVGEQPDEHESSPSPRLRGH